VRHLGLEASRLSLAESDVYGNEQATGEAQKKLQASLRYKLICTAKWFAEHALSGHRHEEKEKANNHVALS
jgi:hypothetical protein